MSVLLIDGSYFIFYRYNATKVWYSRHSGKGTIEQCNIDHPEFKEKYTKHFLDCVTKMKKQLKPKYIFWLKDTPRETIWRYDHNQEYKANRDASAPDEIGAFFKYSYGELIPEAQVLAVDRAEADDVGAVVAKYLNDNYGEVKVNIVTVDADYLQLTNDQTTIHKLPKFERVPVQVKLGKKRVDMDARTFLRVKILMGDKSDEISPVYSGCGPSTAYKLATDMKLFEREIMDDEERSRKYHENERLISFRMIPGSLQSEIVEMFREIWDDQYKKI